MFGVRARRRRATARRRGPTGTARGSPSAEQPAEFGKPQNAGGAQGGKRPRARRRSIHFPHPQYGEEERAQCVRHMRM